MSKRAAGSGSRSVVTVGVSSLVLDCVESNPRIGSTEHKRWPGGRQWRWRRRYAEQIGRQQVLSAMPGCRCTAGILLSARFGFWHTEFVILRYAYSGANGRGGPAARVGEG